MEDSPLENSLKNHIMIWNLSHHENTNHDLIIYDVKQLYIEICLGCHLPFGFTITNFSCNCG